MFRQLWVLVALLAVHNLCLAQNNFPFVRPEPGVSPSLGQNEAVASRPAVPTGPLTNPASPSYGFPSRTSASSNFPTGVAPYSGRSPSDASFLGGRSNPARPTGIYPGPTYTEEPSNSLYDSIPGEPGVDYPVFATTPVTSFNCNQQQFPGYYSDIEARCQVFHICALNKTFSFLCPNGTIFSQETLVCVWWNQFDCSLAQSLYANNAFLYDYLQENKQAAVSGSFQGSNLNLARGQTTRPPGTPGGVFNSPTRPAVPSAFGNTVNPKQFAPGTYPGAGPTPTTGFSTPSVGLPTAFGSTIRPTFSAIPGEAAFGSTPLPSGTTKSNYLPPRLP